MKKFLLIFAIFILAACGANAPAPEDAPEEHMACERCTCGENHADEMQHEPTPPREWTIEELSEIIDSAGIFDEAATHILLGHDTLLGEEILRSVVDATLHSGARYRVVFINGEIERFREICDCGQGYADEIRYQPTPPMNIRETWEDPAELLRSFENVHELTYQQFETDWYSTIILWADSPVSDFSFVSLDVANHSWQDDTLLVIDTQEILLTIDHLSPADAVVLNVAFSHYLLPHAAIIFTDESGARRRMFIHESMRGGCFPVFHLIPHNPERHADWK